MAVKAKVILPVFTLALALVSAVNAAPTAVETPRTIRVVMDSAYAPYSFRSDDGKLQGILVDQWHAWETKTGIKVETYAMDWGEALRRMRAGEFDVIDCIVETAERRDYFDFTPAHATVEASIFFRNDISGITAFASLKGFPVGVKTGDQHVDTLKANGVTTVIPFANNEAIIEAARQRKIAVFVADIPSAVFLLNKSGIDADFRHSAPIFRDELRRAVRKGDVALLRTVTDGFAAIKPREWRAIDDKWFGSTIDKYGSYLTYAAYATIAAMLLVAGLAGWNHMLRTRVLERTSALRDAASELEALSRRLVELQESERKELARELHDRVGQSLTALNINLNIIGSVLPSQASDELRARLADSEALLESTTAVIGNVMAELHPPMLDDQGLMLALEWYARQFSARTGISVTVRGLDSSQRPAPKMEIALFRIAQEALNNVAKHAEAGQVEITLSRVDREYVMTVQDDGIGFDAAEERAGRRPALGMITMRERSLAVGGRLEVRTLARGGARVTVRVPS